MNKKINVNKQRLLQRLDQLAQVSALDGGGVSRLALTDSDKQARDLTVSWMKELGMSVQIDRVGNIIGLRPVDEDISPVLLGSHIDTVTVAGRYDGSYGVMAALEVIHTLNDHDTKTHRPLGVAAFTNEEGVRFNRGMLGSSVYTGDLSVPEAYAIPGIDGSNFGDELKRVGYAGAMEPGSIRPFAFLELHIEQGPLLDQMNIPVGIVDAVTGITWLEVTVKGAANHAGTTPTDLRRDAGLATAKMIEAMRKIATTIGGEQRATCGMIAFEPNAINVIPGKAIFTVDLRNSDGEALLKAEEQFINYAKMVEKSEDVTISIRDLEHVLPVKFDPIVVEAIKAVTDELGISTQSMVSGAGHDAQLIAGMCPTAMIFVPSCAGISHNPDEYSSPEDLETGANVLLHTALRLANQKD